MLYSYQTTCPDRNLQHILHVLPFLKKNPKLTFDFDPNYAIIDSVSFTGSTAIEFSGQYIGDKEDLPNDAPEPRRRLVQVTAFLKRISCG